MNIRLRSLTRIAAASALALFATFTVPSKVRAGHRAHVSLDLLEHEAHHSTARRRVIVTGDPLLYKHPPGHAGLIVPPAEGLTAVVR